MIFFAATKKPTVHLWTLLLSVALLCAQGVNLHVHNLGHEHGSQHGHATLEAAEHSHLSAAHLSSDTSHGEHHDEVVSELDASPNALLKKIAGSVLTLALFAAVLILLFPCLYQPTSHRRRDKGILLAWRYRLSPPLRAPPR